MKLIKTFTFGSILFLLGCSQGAPDLRTLKLNFEGNRALRAQSFSTANEKYLEALSHDPFFGVLHLNLGLSFEGQELSDQALKSYKEAENLAVKNKDPFLIFAARYNQAQLLGKAKKVDEALALYQRALEIFPASIEVKTNIELLTQSQSGQGGDSDKDQKDQDSKGGKGQNPKDQDQKDKKDPKDSKDKNDSEDKDKKEKKEPEQVSQSPKYKPRPFQGKELSEGDVKKILGELKQQEEKIRAEYNRKDVREQPRDKDW